MRDVIETFDASVIRSRLSDRFPVTEKIKMMKGGLAGLMKQAQAMQDNMKKAQEQLAQVEVEGQSGAGMVKVVMSCAHDVRRVSIDPSVMDDQVRCWRTSLRQR